MKINWEGLAATDMFEQFSIDWAAYSLTTWRTNYIEKWRAFIRTN